MFKQDFKYYKSKKPPPDFCNVLDFNNDTNLPENKINVENPLQISEEIIFTLIPPKDWCAFELKSNSGLIFIKNPFTTIGQRYWISRCLKDYTKKPNKLNIDVHNYLSGEQNWWDYCQKLEDDKFTEKLRWATLGYHHNWDTKVYSEGNKTEFPKDLAILCNFIANCLKLGQFKAEAAIVNFYHMDSTLSGHTDHSEKNLDAPLFSFSFGQSAVFLIGGSSMDDKPTPLFLNSGDIVIMTKKSRLSFHGVPKILPAPSNNPWSIKLYNLNRPNIYYNLDNETLKISSNYNLWKPFENYINKSRININVRQVNNYDQPNKE